MRRTLFLLKITAICVLSGCSTKNGNQHVSKLENKPAPDFELAALDGGRVKLSEYRGKPVLLAFFGYECPPCRAEAPHLSELARKHAKDDLIVLAVNCWDEDQGTLAKYVADHKLLQRVLLNGSSVCADLYDVSGVPTCFWINRAGVIVNSHVNFDGPEALERKTKKLIADR